MVEGIKLKANYYTKNNEIVIVELGGYVDQTNSNQIEKIISDILHSGKRLLVFDFSDLIYMSSAGWGIFVGEIKTVREQGGDIKLASMSPEVYEVFQMLEFFHIIQDYPTVADAIASFPAPVSGEFDVEAGNNGDSISELLKLSGLNTNVIKSEADDQVTMDSDNEVREVRKQQVPFTREPDPSKESAESEFQPKVYEPKIDIAKLPLHEKIKRVVATYPLLNIFQIRKMLRHEKFGYTQIGLIKLFQTLKFLNLENKTKRYRFYRST